MKRIPNFKNSCTKPVKWSFKLETESFSGDRQHLSPQSVGYTKRTTKYADDHIHVIDTNTWSCLTCSWDPKPALDNWISNCNRDIHKQQQFSTDSIPLKMAKYNHNNEWQYTHGQYNNMVTVYWTNYCKRYLISIAHKHLNKYVVICVRPE